MALRCIIAGFLLAFVCLPREAHAEDKEPTVIIELGGAAGYSLKGGGASGGPNIAAEVPIVENWLEVEAGVTPFFGHGGPEWDTDLVFKKPFDLTEKLEFAVGVGPGWVHTTGAGRADALAVEGILELAYWFRAQHDIGLYVEPSYDYSFGRGHEQSLGVTIGLRIGIP